MSESKSFRPATGSFLIIDDDLARGEGLYKHLELDHAADAVLVADLAAAAPLIRDRSFEAVVVSYAALCTSERDDLTNPPTAQAISIARDIAPARLVVLLPPNQAPFGLADEPLDDGDQRARSRIFLTLVPSPDPAETANELKDLITLRSEPRTRNGDEPPTPRELGIIGRDANFADVLETLQRIKDVDTTVLITGESGTGKELIARAIHRYSYRADERFEAINCGAIPENLLESQLFGHKRGAFTDAKMDRKGIFELCSAGTLLLDEIGDMPLSLQVKLLRVLQEKEIMPLGASRAVKINTRVLAATNRNLEEEVRLGRFRADLYFRLSVLRLAVPPLREHRDDIPLLVDHFIKCFNRCFGRNVRRPSDELLAQLVAYEWPGNVRELQNAVERGVILSRDDELHLEDVIPDRIHRLPLHTDVPAPVPTEVHSSATEDPTELCLTEAKERFERHYLVRLLDATRGHIAEAARRSGRYRADIYRLMTKHGLKLEDFRPPHQAAEGFSD